MDFWGVLGLIALIVLMICIGLAFVRGQNINYRTGKGMFEHSDFNLEDDKEISDKEYYDGDKGLFK